MTKTPIAYIIFNRPSITKQSFAVLKEQKPLELFIIADGPRSEHPNDKKNCAKVRKIVEQIDWPCKVHRDYAEINLGLKKRISSGLNWVFENVEKAIVLEDDCIAHPDFFHFCDNLLDYYADNNKVSVITGNNFQKGQWRGDASYYFSKYNHCWGWATWRRAWKHYQGDIPFWPEWINKKSWFNLFPDKIERHYWEMVFKRVHEGKIDTWDYSWTASTWYKGGLTATPNVNLVSNIGFGDGATHTKSKNSKLSNIPTMKLGHITHPKQVIIDKVADRFAFDNVFGGKYQRFPFNWLIFPYRVFNYIFRKIITR